MITRAVLFEQFDGRDEELRHLVELRAKSARELSGATVSIVGEAGIGKSRLLSEFQAATARQRGAFVRIRCEELPVAYAPFVRALEELQHFRELRRVNALAVATQLLTTIDEALDEDPVLQKRKVFDSLIAALGESARRLGQLTLVVDDVHWSDLSSLEALRMLARAVRALPMVLVIAYRSEDLASNHGRALAIAEVERENGDRIVLGPLSFRDVASLLRRPMPEARKELLQRIYDLSEGKPYVAEELARSIVERGSGIDPETTLSLRSAVLERVARLSPGDRKIVERAAVLGRNFAPDDLSALGASREQLFGALRAGLALQIFEEREVEGVPWYRFRHALTREILYRDLLAIERRALHLEIADHLATRGDRAAELAYHLSAAGDAARAAPANERAGDEAIALSAFGDAASLFKRALDFTSAPEDVARVGLKFAECFQHTGDPDELVSVTLRNVEILERTNRNNDAIAILIAAYRGLVPTRFADRFTLQRRAAALLEPDTPANLRFDVEVLAAWLLAGELRVDEARAACDRAEACSTQLTADQRDDLSLARANVYLRSRRGDPAPAMRALDALVLESSGNSRNRRLMTASQLRAMASYGVGKTRSAFEHSLEGASLNREMRRELWEFEQRCNAAFYAARLGDFAFVNALVESARRDGFEISETLQAARVRTVRAIGGDIAPFLELFEHAVEEETPFLVYALGCDLPWMVDDRSHARAIAMRALERMSADCIEGGLVEAILEFGNDDDVSRALEMLFELECPEGYVLHEAHLALVRARVARREHRTIEAAQHARDAIALATRIESWMHLSTAYELAGDYEAARKVLVRVGAAAELARLERRRPASRAEPASGAAELTQREEQIARLIVAGLSSRQAGERLAIGHRTVETHLANVYAKLGVNSRAQLAAHFTLGTETT